MPFDLIESSDGVTITEVGPVDLVEEALPADLLSVGVPGLSGLPGADGDSAYAVWLEAGNTGSMSDFLLSLKGEKGDQGNPGLSGANYVHDQAVPSSAWVILHGLNRYPSVTVVDSAGTVLDTDVHYDSANQLTSYSDAPFAGKAYLN